MNFKPVGGRIGRDPRHRTWSDRSSSDRSWSGRPLLVLLVMMITLTGVIAGCGDGSDDGTADGTDGPLTVDDLLDDPPSGDIEVRGLLFDDGSGLVLCGALAESFPPQCPGPFVPIANPQDVEATFTEDGSVRWTDQVATLTGRMKDGALEVQ